MLSLQKILGRFVFLGLFLASNGFASDWLTQALQLQREIDINAALNEATFIGTHNSYNAKAYEIPFTRYIDPNQLLSLRQQLDVAARSLELDVHWALNKNFNYEILLCHGRPTHFGCSLEDRSLKEGLQEIATWLNAHPHEIILLYLERHLDGHEPRLAFYLNQYLGNYIYKPPANNLCSFLPSPLTKAAILEKKKQVIVVTQGCDYGTKENNKFKEPLQNIAFAGIGGIPKYMYGFLETSITAFGLKDCGKAVFGKDTAHRSLWRVYEDQTALGRMRGERSMTAHDITTLMSCGINWPVFDMLVMHDARLYSVIWSWAYSYPKTDNGHCAYYAFNEGIKNFSCDKIMPGFLCQHDKTRSLHIIRQSGPWAEGSHLCSQLGEGWKFATPINGLQMMALKSVMHDTAMSSVWLNYSLINNRWEANA